MQAWIVQAVGRRILAARMNQTAQQLTVTQFTRAQFTALDWQTLHKQLATWQVRHSQVPVRQSAHRTCIICCASIISRRAVQFRLECITCMHSLGMLRDISGTQHKSNLVCPWVQENVQDVMEVVRSQ